MILCSVSLTNMAALLNALLILSGLSGIQSITTVSKVSVKAGGSITVPCLYSSKYRNHVKYLCGGYNWNFCNYKVKSKTTSRSGGFSISDDEQENIFTVTIDAKTAGTHYYWCAVEINKGKDLGTFFELLVTKDQAALSVDHQEVTGFTGESLTIHFRYDVLGLISWCRLGDSCVMEGTNKEWEGLRVTITSMVTPPIITVTLSGLKTQSSGWYFLCRGDQKMPVYITVKERPSTTTPKTTTRMKTSPSTLRHVKLTSVPTVTTMDTKVNTPVNTTGQTGSQRISSFQLTLIILVSLLVLILLLAMVLWIICRKHKQTKTQSSAAAVAEEEEVTYSTVSHYRPTKTKKAEEGVTYSTVSHSRQANRKAEEGVTYSTVSHSTQPNRKAEEGVTYSTISHSRQAKRKPGPNQEEDVTYSTAALH